MPRPKVVVVVDGAVVEDVRGEEGAAEEGEAPIIITLVRGTGMEEELVAIRAMAEVLGVVDMAAGVEAVGEGAMEVHNKATGKLLKPLSLQCYL